MVERRLCYTFPCTESLEPMPGLGQVILHKMAGLGFILVSPVQLALKHDLAWARFRKCVLCS